jgi:hypothetical protein
MAVSSGWKISKLNFEKISVIHEKKNELLLETETDRFIERGEVERGREKDGEGERDREEETGRDR